MKCVVNRKSVLDKCFEIANNTNNIGTFSEEDNIYLQKAYSAGRKLAINTKNGNLVKGRLTGVSDDFIGTGEGLQAYGWGHYMASLYDIAKQYAKDRANETGKSVVHTFEVPDNNRQNYLVWEEEVPEEQLSKITKELKKRNIPDENYIEGSLDGSDLYWRLSSIFNEINHNNESDFRSNSQSAREASQFLDSIGIIGSIHHSDTDHPNYVIFSEKNIKVTNWNPYEMKEGKLVPEKISLYNTIKSFISDFLTKYNFIEKEEIEGDYANEREITKKFFEEQHIHAHELLRKLFSNNENLNDVYLKHFVKPLNEDLEKKLHNILVDYGFEIFYEGLNEVYGHCAIGKVDLLNKIITVAQNRNRITLPEEFSRAFIELMGGRYHIDTKKFPETKVYTKLFFDIEKTEIFKRVFDEYKDTYTYSNGTPNVTKIKKEAMGQALAAAISEKYEENNSDISFLTKLKNWFFDIANRIASIFSKNAEFEMLIKDIASSIMSGTYKKKYLDKIDYTGYQRVDFNETLDKQTQKDIGVATVLLKTLNRNNSLITGSLALRATGTIYRKNQDTIHDIDVIVPEDISDFNKTHPIFQQIFFGNKQYRRSSEEYVEMAEHLPYFNKLKKDLHNRLKLCVAFPSYFEKTLVVSGVYSQDEDLVNKFYNLDGNMQQRYNKLSNEEKEKIYILDFFLSPKNKSDYTIKRYFSDHHGAFSLVNYSVPFSSKLKFGRAKDIADYQYFSPFENSRYRDTTDPTSDFMFQKNNNQLNENNLYSEHLQQSGINFKRDSRIESLIYNRDTEESSYEKELDIKDAIGIISSNSEYNAVISLLKELSKTQKSKYLEGLKIVVDSKHQGKKRAYYDASTQTIHIDGFAQYKNGDCSSVLLHEIMHHLTVERLKYDTEARNNLQNILDEYNKKFPSITYLKEHALEEFVADIWSDETTINNLKNIETNDRSLWNKILDFFKNIISGIFKNSKDTLFQDASVELANLLTTDFDEISTYRENKVSNPIFYENQNTINDDIIHSTNADASNAIENRINRTFPVQPSIVKRIDDNTIRIGDTTKVEEVYKIRESARNTGTKVTSFRRNSQILSHVDTSFITQLKKNLTREQSKLNTMLSTFYANIDRNKLSVQELANLDKEFNLLNKTKSDIDELLEKITSNKNDDVAIIDNTDIILSFVERIMDYVNPKYAQVIPITNYRGDTSIGNILSFVVEYQKDYYPDSSSATTEALDLELQKRVDEQHKRFNEIVKDYETYLNKKAYDIIKNSPITKKYRYLRDIVSNNDLLKEHFSTEGKDDIRWFESFLFAMDNNWMDDSMIKQFMGKVQEMIELEQNTEYFNDRKKLVELLKELKPIGINLERRETFEWFFEKFKNGQETGRFINCFTPEFDVYLDAYSRIRPIFTEKRSDRNDAKQKRKLSMFKDNFNILNIFVLPEFAEGSIEFKQLDELSGGYLSLHKDDIFKTDEEYQRKMKSILGLQYNIILNAYSDVINRCYLDFATRAADYIREQEELGIIVSEEKAMDIIRNRNSHRNAYSILLNLLKIQNGESIEPYIATNENNLYYNYNMVPIIPNPKKGEFYNEDFRKHFSEGVANYDLMKKFYETMIDIYGNKIGVTFYNDSKNFQYAKLEEDWVDSSIGLASRLKFGKVLKQFGSTFRDSFFEKQFREVDNNRVMLNYVDEPLRQFGKTMDMLETASSDALIYLIKKYKIEGLYDEATDSFLEDVEIVRHVIAHKITQRGFSENFFKSTANLLELRANQITRERCFNVARLMLHIYKQQKPGEKTRIKGIGQFEDQINRAYIGNSRKKPIKLLDSSRMGNIVKMSDSRNANSIERLFGKIIKLLFTRENPSSSELNDVLREINLNMDGDRSACSFKFNDVTYIYDSEKKAYFKKADKSIRLERIDEEEFKQKLMDLNESKISENMEYMTFTSFLDGILSMLSFKFMGGIPIKTGLFNRAEGGIANSEMDITGEFWEPGDYINAQKALPWIELSKLLTSDGKIPILNAKAIGGKKWLKKLLILKYIVDRGGIMQDMSNVFDRSLEGSRKTDIKNVLNMYNVSIHWPEYRNQIVPVGAMLMDSRRKIKLTKRENIDKYGEYVNICDKKMNFIFLDINLDNGEVVLKDDFKDEPGCQEWITFATTKKDTSSLIPQIKTTDIFEFVYDAKSAIHTIQGDYREKFKKWYSSFRTGAAMFFLKGWWPEKFKRAFSEGENLQLRSADNKGVSKTLPGKYYTAINKGGFVVNLTSLAISGISTSKGLLGKAVAAGIVPLAALTYAGYMKFSKKSAFNVNEMSYVDGQYIKALVLETLLFLPRILSNAPLLRYIRFNPTEFIYKRTFQDTERLSALGDGDINRGRQHARNINALARESSFVLYILAMGYASMFLWWDPDDTDNDKRRQFLNFVRNNLGRISNTLLSFINITDNVEQNFDFSELPAIDIIQSVNKYLQYKHENNVAQKNKYLLKVLPIPRVLPKDFLPYSEYNFYQDMMYDRDIMDYKTKGEKGAETYYSHVYRAALKKAIFDVYEDEKLSQEFREQLDKKLLTPDDIAEGKTCYDLKKKGMLSHYQSMIIKAIGDIIPKKDKADTYQETIEKVYNYYEKNKDWIGDVPQMEKRTPYRTVSWFAKKYQGLDEEEANDLYEIDNDY